MIRIFHNVLLGISPLLVFVSTFSLPFAAIAWAIWDFRIACQNFHDHGFSIKPFTGGRWKIKRRAFVLAGIIAASYISHSLLIVSAKLDADDRITHYIKSHQNDVETNLTLTKIQTSLAALPYMGGSSIALLLKFIFSTTDSLNSKQKSILEETADILVKKDVEEPELRSFSEKKRTEAQTANVRDVSNAQIK